MNSWAIKGDDFRYLNHDSRVRETSEVVVIYPNIYIIYMYNIYIYYIYILYILYIYIAKKTGSDIPNIGYGLKLGPQNWDVFLACPI